MGTDHLLPMTYDSHYPLLGVGVRNIKWALTTSKVNERDSCPPPAVIMEHFRLSVSNQCLSVSNQCSPPKTAKYNPATVMFSLFYFYFLVSWAWSWSRQEIVICVPIFVWPSNSLFIELLQCYVVSLLLQPFHYTTVSWNKPVQQIVQSTYFIALPVHWLLSDLGNTLGLTTQVSAVKGLFENCTPVVN